MNVKREDLARQIESVCSDLRVLLRKIERLGEDVRLETIKDFFVIWTLQKEQSSELLSVIQKLNNLVDRLDDPSDYLNNFYYQKNHPKDNLFD